MESETSAIARKLQNFVLIENEQIHEPHFNREALAQAENEPGILKNILLIILMGSAVFFTHLSLVFVNWTKKLEG
jgi:hypoxanthine-guanine phosphoribosyltransferase